MIIIRADGNGTIGLGHIMRCLSIADALRKQDEVPLFVTACQEGVSVIRERGYEVVVIPTDYRKMEDELPILKQLIQEEQRIKMLVD